jgi:hypothetical protein
MIRVTINYGYDIHHIDLDEKTYAAIKDGQKIELVGQGFVHEEDGEVADYWFFNRGESGEIYFSLDNGAEFYAQDFWVDPAP